MRIYWIDEFEHGRLGMTARPRGNDWLEDELKHIKQLGVGTVVSLLEKSEIEELGLMNEKSICDLLGIDFISFPIPDRQVPADKKGFRNLASGLTSKLPQNEKVVIHCRMGIGRTSMLCAAVLILNGFKKEFLFKTLSEYRTLEVPDTEEQQQWILDVFCD